MAVKMITPQKKIEKMILSDAKRKEMVILNVYRYLGELCITEARNGGTYKDQTGNLRSSIGYVILNNGKVVTQVCYESSKGADKKSGTKQGSTFLKKLAKENTKGIVFIMVAGMNYAVMVEAKGFNVLTSAELLAENMMPKLMNQLGL